MSSPTTALRGRDLIGLGGLLAGCGHRRHGARPPRSTSAADTAPVFTMVGVFLGMVAGAVGFWARVRAALEAEGSP